VTALADRIDAALADVDLGTPAAYKRGRDARWPYVPVVLVTNDVGRTVQQQVMGLAYATLPEAYDAAREASAAALRHAKADPADDVCPDCDCADPTAVDGLADDCDCECHGVAS
jgi:hypothetical protein